MTNIYASQPHSDLWFPDGSVVLRTNMYLFRVHKSILARESSVFNDMFAFPVAGENNVDGGDVGNVDEYDGLPVVPLIGDDDEAVVHLLKLIYEPNYHRAGEVLLKLPRCAMLFKLATKYHFSGVEDALKQELKVAFPEALVDFRLEESMVIRHHMFLQDQLLPFLPLVQGTELASTVPALFYCCSQYSISDILAKGLTPEITAFLLVSRERFKHHLSGTSTERVEHFHVGLAKCTTSPRCRVAARLAHFNQLCQSQTVTTSSDGQDFFTMAIPESAIALCGSCTASLPSIIGTILQGVWKLLPEIFELTAQETT